MRGKNITAGGHSYYIARRLVFSFLRNLATFRSPTGHSTKIHLGDRIALAFYVDVALLDTSCVLRIIGRHYIGLVLWYQVGKAMRSFESFLVASIIPSL